MSDNPIAELRRLAGEAVRLATEHTRPISRSTPVCPGSLMQNVTFYTTT
jgi:hypothetical protein